MNRRVVCALVAVFLVALALPAAAQAPPNPADSVRGSLDEAARNWQRALPVLQNTIEVLRSELPAMVDIMQRASERGAATVPRTVRLDAKGMPDTEMLTRQIDGLKAAMDVLREVLPRLEEMRTRIQDGVRAGPRRSSTPPVSPAKEPGSIPPGFE